MKKIIIIPTIMLLALPEILFAADPTQNTSLGAARFGAAFWITLAIVYLSRKRAIGGWLLYYYCCLYAGIIFTILTSVTFINDLNPSDWPDKTLYLLYLASTIPSNVVLIIEVIFATRLLLKKKRTLSNVNILRYILIAAAVFNLIGVVIDAKYFEDSIILSVWGLITSIIWCMYFYFSKRVLWVLVENRWDHDEFTGKKSSENIVTDKVIGEDGVKIHNGNKYVSQKGKEGEAFCLGCRAVDALNNLYYCRETDQYYHEKCIGSAFR